MEDKRCPTCDTVKPHTEYSKHRSAYDGLGWQCRLCAKATSAAYRASLRTRTDPPGPCRLGHPRFRTQNGTPRCRTCKNAIQRAARERNKTDPRYIEKRRRIGRDWVRNTRDKALTILGNACTCCGQQRRVFLHIDHIHGNGRTHRREMKVRNSYRICSWIVRHPAEAAAQYQVLCANCNMAKAIEENHTCP